MNGFGDAVSPPGPEDVRQLHLDPCPHSGRLVERDPERGCMSGF